MFYTRKLLWLEFKVLCFMDVNTILKNLHPLEIKVLRRFEKDTILSVALLIEKLNFKEGHANQAFSWLGAKGLIQEAFIKEKTKAKLPEIATELNISFKDAGTAFALLSKDGLVKMDDEKNVIYIEDIFSKRREIISNLLQKASSKEDHIIKDDSLTKEEREVIGSIAKKRGAVDVPFKIIEREEIIYKFTNTAYDVQKALENAGITGDELGRETLFR